MRIVEHENRQRENHHRTSARGIVSAQRPVGIVDSPRGFTATRVRSLQRHAGNRAVAAQLDSAARSRSGGTASRVDARPETATSSLALQRVDNSSPPPVVERLRGLQTVVANGVTLGATPYQRTLPIVRQRMAQKFNVLDERFTQAHTKHEEVLSSASESAENYNFWAGIIVGAAASLAAGAAIGAIPFVAAAEVGGTLWWGAQGVSAATSTGGGAIGTSLIQRDTNFASVMPSNLMQVEGLQSMLSFEQRATSVLSSAVRLAQLHIYATDWLNAIRDPDSFGMTAGEAEANAVRFERQARGADAAAAALPGALRGLLQVQTAIEQWRVPSRSDLERAVWVYWIKTLDYDDHDKLDEDDLEDYLHRSSVGVLGSNGLLGVDTRHVWDTDEEMKAIVRARVQWPDVRRSLSGP